MYAIRSYYGFVGAFAVVAGDGETDPFLVELFFVLVQLFFHLVGDDDGVGSLELGDGQGDLILRGRETLFRITSYNVCYTKLLRRSTGSAFFSGWSILRGSFARGEGRCCVLASGGLEGSAGFGTCFP